MRHYQNTLTAEVVSGDEYSYAAVKKGNWVLYPKIPRYTIETPPYAAGRTEFDEDGKLCYWDDVRDIVIELEELKATVIATKSCTWTEDADGNWHTGCQEIHVLIVSTPHENGYVFCPYCGGKIDVGVLAAN